MDFCIATLRHWAIQSRHGCSGGLAQLIVAVDPRSPVPLFEQVRAQIATAIESGQLPAEQRLPTVRQLAADLRLAVNTVARAYQELESAGLVRTGGRNGTFVAGQSSEAHHQAERFAREFTARMRQIGVGPQEALAIVRRQLSNEAAAFSSVPNQPSAAPP
jgi:DNA-binding transcriptional regulator YhcF (GntR family)